MPPSKTPEAVSEYDIEDHELPTFLFIEVNICQDVRLSEVLPNSSGHDRDGQVGHWAVLPATQRRRRYDREAGKPDPDSV